MSVLKPHNLGTQLKTIPASPKFGFASSYKARFPGEMNN